MKCSKCGAKFAADINQPAPGGSSSPGIFFILSLIFAVLLAILVLLDLNLVWIVICCLALVFSFVANLNAYSDCSSELGPDGETIKGVSCPACGAKNDVKPWSL